MSAVDISNLGFSVRLTNALLNCAFSYPGLNVDFRTDEDILNFWSNERFPEIALRRLPGLGGRSLAELKGWIENRTGVAIARIHTSDTASAPPRRVKAAKQLKLRIPTSLHAELVAAASDTGRSLNSEIIARLGESLTGTTLRQIVREEISAALPKHPAIHAVNTLEPQRADEASR